MMKDILARILVDPRYIEGITYGKPRKGHQEGSVANHIADLIANLDRIKHLVNDEDFYKLLILIHVHDTFKLHAERDVPIDQHNSHASLARNFLAEFTDDIDLLNMVQYHDENFALWKQMKYKGKYNEKRFRERVCIGILDISLFLLFTIIDGYTFSKMALANEEAPEKLRWFVFEIKQERHVNQNVLDALEIFGL